MSETNLIYSSILHFTVDMLAGRVGMTLIQVRQQCSSSVCSTMHIGQVMLSPVAGCEIVA